MPNILNLKSAIMSFCFIFMAITSSITNAAPITFIFEGNVNFVSTALSDQFNTSQTMSGQYTFDDTAIDSVIFDPNNAIYATAVTDLFATIDDYSVASGGGPILVLNDSPNDAYIVPMIVIGADVGIASPSTFTINLIDSTTSVFDSDALLVSPPDLNNFDTTTWELEFDGGLRVSGEVTSLTSASAVPIPAAAWLFGSGLLGLVGMARRKKA